MKVWKPILVLAVFFALVGFACTRSVTFDDAYISLRYAHRLWHGHGLVFNPGERVEGYTNLLWVLITLDSITVAKAIGILSYAALGALLTSFAVQKSPVALLALPVALLPIGMAEVSTSGLETVWVAMLGVAMGLVHHVWKWEGKSWRALAMALPIAIVLSRPDGILFVVASSLANRKQIRLFAPLSIVLALWATFKWTYYGALLPNTYWAKHAESGTWAAGWAYLCAFSASYPAVLWLGPFVLGALALAWKTPLRDLAIFAGLSTLLYALYVVQVGGDFMHYRFAFEILPLYVLLAMIGLVLLPPHSAGAALVALLLCRGSPTLESRYYMQSIEEMNGYAEVGKRVGLALRVLPKDTRIATTLNGSVPYFSDLFTIDQFGLTDRFVGHQRSLWARPRGHLKPAPVDYLQRRGVNLVMGHPVICPCDHPCSEDDKDNLFIRIDETQCVRTWMLTRSPSLDSAIATNPHHLVFVERKTE